MKLLLENWREYLNEGMKMPEDLSELGSNISVAIYRNNEDFEVTFVETNRTGMKIEKNRPDLGHINLFKAGEDGECAGAWVIGVTSAKGGWGPMLYDVAIEMASKKHMGGGGVTPDRNTVSSDARAIWDYYLNNRNDVISKQLDDKENPQTPDKSDDCNQTSARASEDWRDSSLSKVYVKTDGAMMKKLHSLGRLIVR
tara:strand:- start:606 stop:1199 length:594 start_codon:yes stop_codon:yes gene_type:complete